MRKQYNFEEEMDREVERAYPQQDENRDPLQDKIDEMKLVIPRDVYNVMMGYVLHCETEITWFNDIEYDEGANEFRAGRSYLITQVAGGADVEIDEDVMAKANYELIKIHKLKQLPRLWCHSHVNMKAFFSGTDWGTIKNELINDTFFVALVMNKRQEMEAVAKIMTPIPLLDKKRCFYVNPLKIIIEDADIVIPEAIKKEVDEKVTARKYVAQKALPQRSGAYYNDKVWNGSQFVKPQKLSRDKSKALQMVKSLKLKKEWNTDLGFYVWKNPATGTIWIDEAKVLAGYGLEEVLYDAKKKKN